MASKYQTHDRNTSLSTNNKTIILDSRERMKTALALNRIQRLNCIKGGTQEGFYTTQNEND